MELLLWMWFYDPRWVFNVKIPVQCYKFAWLIPLLIHLFLSCFCFYYLHFSDTPNCDSTLKLWLFCRTIFSVLISVNIIIFMWKISNVYARESKYFDNALNIYPEIQQSLSNYDYWIRRKSLISTPGVLLLFLGIVSLFWSYLMINIRNFESKFAGCDKNILALLHFDSVLVIFGDFLIFVVLICVGFLKIGSFICAYTCPGFLRKLSRFCNRYKVKNFET